MNIVYVSIKSVRNEKKEILLKNELETIENASSKKFAWHTVYTDLVWFGLVRFFGTSTILGY